MKTINEEIAEYAHEAWSGWMIYLFSKCTENEDGTITIAKESVDRWKRQSQTAYDDLPEKEKESDRAEAKKMLSIFADKDKIISGCPKCGGYWDCGINPDGSAFPLCHQCGYRDNPFQVPPHTHEVY